MLDPSTVTRPVEKLQSKGLVTRKTQGRTSLDLFTDPSASISTYSTNGWPVGQHACSRSKRKSQFSLAGIKR